MHANRFVFHLKVHTFLHLSILDLNTVFDIQGAHHIAHIQYAYHYFLFYIIVYTFFNTYHFFCILKVLKLMKTDGLSAKYLIRYMNIVLVLAEQEILYSYYIWQLLA